MLIHIETYSTTVCVCGEGGGGGGGVWTLNFTLGCESIFHSNSNFIF